MDQSRITLETTLIEKAWADEKFRTELIANPKDVIEKLIGQALPQNMQISGRGNSQHPIPADSCQSG